MEKKENMSTPVPLKRISTEGDFWKREIELIRDNVIPYQWEVLNDRVEDAPKSFCIHNFKIAGNIARAKKENTEGFKEPVYTFRGFEALPEDPDHLKDEFYGFVFQDSDLFKWIEAASYILVQYPDAQLEAEIDYAVKLICEAQQPDGYLDTYYIINGMDRIFTNLKDHHELYCFGHLTEAAVAYYMSTGKDSLLKAAKKYASFISEKIGPEAGKKRGYPGHEIAEMALVRLYDVTGDKKYLELAQYFIDERGAKPFYFDSENELSAREKANDMRYRYYQAHMPVREQDKAVGHAVRAVYLYSGMAAAAKYTGDEKLYEACLTLWDDITQKQMYITGGIGQTAHGEAFTCDYDLPNDTIYAETCASIGLVFFARRMLEMKPDSRYADVCELALHNGILSGIALDGKSFFYVNPLYVNPKVCGLNPDNEHVKPVRQKWFGCACCPPNLARLVSSIGEYAYTENEDTLWIHLYTGGSAEKTIDGHKITIKTDSKLPWDGEVRISADTDAPVRLTAALRIPAWCKDEFEISGAVGKECSMKDGYMYISGEWSGDEEIILKMNMRVRIMQADSRVRKDEGRVAIMRGPVIYCLEQKDNGENLDLIYMTDHPEFKEEITDEFGYPVTVIKAKAKRKHPVVCSGLYNEYQKPEYDDCEIRFIPYYTWANRGEGEMQVWVNHI